MNREVCLGSHSLSHSSPVPHKPHGFCGRKHHKRKRRITFSFTWEKCYVQSCSRTCSFKCIIPLSIIQTSFRPHCVCVCAQKNGCLHNRFYVPSHASRDFYPFVSGTQKHSNKGQAIFSLVPPGTIKYNQYNAVYII